MSSLCLEKWISPGFESSNSHVFHSFYVFAGLGLSISWLLIIPEIPRAVSWDEIQKEPWSLPYQTPSSWLDFPFSLHPIDATWVNSVGSWGAFALVVESVKPIPKCSQKPAEMASGGEKSVIKCTGISLKGYKIRNLSHLSFICSRSLLPCQTGLIGVSGD